MEVRVWVGCLAHYNNAILSGAWVEASKAGEWTCPLADPDDIYANCEETWVMDQEIPGVDGEMDPMTAVKWAEVFAELDDDQAEAFAAFLAHADHPAPSDDLHDRFQSCYRGEWGSERDYAMNHFEEMYGHYADEEIETGRCGIKEKRVPEVFTQYFDWDHYAHELFRHHGYTYDKGHVFEEEG